MHEDQPVPPQADHPVVTNTMIIVGLLVAIGALYCMCLGSATSIITIEQYRPSQTKTLVFVPTQELLADSRFALWFNLKDGVDIIKKNIEYIHLHSKFKLVDYHGVVSKNEKQMAMFGLIPTNLNCTYHIMTSIEDPYLANKHHTALPHLPENMPHDDITLLGSLSFSCASCYACRPTYTCLTCRCIDYLSSVQETNTWLVQHCD